MMKLRLGVADDPTQLQPSLSDCLAAVLKRADALMADVLKAVEIGTAASGPGRIPAFQQPALRHAILALQTQSVPFKADFVTELTRLVYEGGGKDQTQTEVLRYEDLQLFADDQLDQSIELARAQQEVAQAVDDTLPALDALVSTMLGWRTIQPGLNPLRPDVFVRALQHALALHVTNSQVRETLITPAAGLLGVHLRKLYRELAEWLRSTGVEPAVPLGGRIDKSTGAAGKPVTDTVAKTLLTLDRLRKLIAGDFDPPRKGEFLHTMPASMSMLQELKKAEELVKRLEQRPKPTSAPAQPVDMLAQVGQPPAAPPRIGEQLGQEVVRLMFDHLGDDRRLLPSLKGELRAMEPAVHRLAKVDSRFFSDRTHPGRVLLDRITQRSLAFTAEDDPGWPRFLGSVASASRWLESKVVDADTFRELLEILATQWDVLDEGAKQKREEAAKALLHAEQRNLLAQKLAGDFVELLEGLDVAEFVRDFLKNAWAQVVADAQLSCKDGSSDPHGYRALVDDLVWSVQKSSAQRGRVRRLVQMIPTLLQRMREGLQRIAYPPELTQRFFDHLITVHKAAVHEGRDPAAQAAADAAWTAESQFSEEDVEMWLDHVEVQESGYVDFPGIETGIEHVASAEAAQQEAHAREQEAQQAVEAGVDPEPAVLRPEEMRLGAWVEIHIKGEWVRAQLTWASPHATLFMFTSVGGTAHSMSRRTLDRLRASEHLRIVADRPVVDEALDQVAQAALKNSLDGKGS
ncbi:DUF1631 family protein [Ramlibacter sp.]|uniref:DUF1631 family protein n=1 Tax=Ramlibacter sp. TaxID=1917967 RepID=UPI0026263924|nr:DUF1631 family protein [Ramlibacter sp.]